jgi:hypothetical protein
VNQVTSLSFRWQFISQSCHLCQNETTRTIYCPWTGNSVIDKRIVDSHCTWRRHLHFMGSSEIAIRWKCWQKEEFSYHVMLPEPSSVGRRFKIFGCECLDPRDISMASVRQVLALAMGTVLFWRAILKIGAHNGSSSCLSARTHPRFPPPFQLSIFKYVKTITGLERHIINLQSDNVNTRT